MENKKRFTKLKIAIGAAVLVVIVVLVLNVGVKNRFFAAGGCISVVFDKFPMMLADRVVICVRDARYEITDRDLINQIARETMCAGSTDLCSHNTDRWIEIYRGDTLVRRMRWEENHDAIIYQEDSRHWVFPSIRGKGMIYVSDGLLAKLNKVISTPPANP